MGSGAMAPNKWRVPTTSLANNASDTYDNSPSPTGNTMRTSQHLGATEGTKTVQMPDEA